MCECRCTHICARLVLAAAKGRSFFVDINEVVLLGKRLGTIHLTEDPFLYTGNTHRLTANIHKRVYNDSLEHYTQ